MIDMHLHAVHPRLPGVRVFSALVDGPPTLAAAGLQQEMAEVGVTQALGMGCLSDDPEDPLGIEGTLRIAALVPGLFPIGIADPRKTGDEHLAAVEAQLRSGQVKALKAYLGYLHIGPDSPHYRPYYELAAQFDLPFIFHTGDTYSERAKVKYAHPLLVDEVAVDFRQVRFVLAHVGNPWLVDAAEVIYKNDNVWADLSGLLVGDDAYFHGLAASGALERIAQRIRYALEYTEKPDRFLYGSDWPLAPMAAYVSFVRQIVPEEWQEAVFATNARELFRLEVKEG
jgi:hypothetical protein